MIQVTMTQISQLQRSDDQLYTSRMLCYLKVFWRTRGRPTVRNPFAVLSASSPESGQIGGWSKENKWIRRMWSISPDLILSHSTQDPSRREGEDSYFQAVSSVERCLHKHFTHIHSDDWCIYGKHCITHLDCRLRSVHQKSTPPADWSSEVGRGRSPGWLVRSAGAQRNTWEEEPHTAWRRSPGFYLRGV